MGHYMKEYEKCSRCTSVHEDVWVRKDGCPSCHGKSESKCKAIAKRITDEAKASAAQHKKRRRYHALIAAHDAVLDNSFLALAPKTPKNPLCKKCQTDRKHRQRCKPCRAKGMAILGNSYS